MPAKHTARPLGPARIFLSGAAAVLVMLVVWIAVRAVGPVEAAQEPKVVLPPPPPPSPAVSLMPSPTPSPSSLSVAPSRSSARPSATSRSPKPSSTSSRPTPSRTTSAPRAGFSVTVSVTSSWDQGYVASVRVQNTGKATGSWTVTVSHANLWNLRLLGTWGTAQGAQSGDNVIFTGGPLAAGASTGFGYQVSGSGRSGNTRPSGCSVVGGRCGVS